jgi:hypothetical protein
MEKVIRLDKNVVTLHGLISPEWKIPCIYGWENTNNSIWYIGCTEQHLGLKGRMWLTTRRGCHSRR